MIRFFTVLMLVLCLIINTTVFSGTTGKIAGKVIEKATGDPLPGVNIIIEGENIGAATDLEGYYVILNIPPGEYELSAMMIGYSPKTFVDVRINIDQTTTIDVELSEEALETEAIVVVAERPVVEQDVAASRVNISSEEIKALPIVSVRAAVGLQAGIEGLSFRGSGGDEVAFVVDGVTLRNERNNQPYSAISYTSVEEIQVQSGGFNAEYGNIRSGVVNIVTKEGNRNKYNFSFIGRYRFAAPKHFGHSPNSPDSYWIKPYIDDAVCWTGTENGAWDSHTQAQYPEFKGWNKISEETLRDGDPNSSLSPLAAQQLFLYQHRRQLDIDGPDYNIDMSFGGPVPYISEDLGNLRFNTSYRQAQTMYIIPVSDDAFRDYNWQLKLTSDVGENMKLMFSGLLGRETGTADNNSGSTGIFKYTYEIPAYIDMGFSYADGAMYGTDYWALASVDYTSFALKFTHVLSPSTFYEASLQRFSSKYDTNPGTLRDNSLNYLFGNNYYVNEAPFGFEPASPKNSINGMNMGTGFANSRDSSKVATYRAKFDISSQLDRYNFIKAGIEFKLTRSEVNYARYDAALHSRNQQTKWDRTPIQGTLYLQDKLEWEGMIAQVGLRMDYFNAGGDWYEYEQDQYNIGFSGTYSDGIDTLLEKKPTKHIITFSPRLAVSFPITKDSKLYFNYGHFRQMPTPEYVYILRRSGSNNSINRIGSPNNPLEKTVAYELGYEHNLFDQFLVRAAGYYKDESDMAKTVEYINEDASVKYYVSEPNYYRDQRGFELSLNKNRGNWVRGFINYTYRLNTYGYFGYGKHYESRAQQRDYEKGVGAEYHYQNRPVAQPLARTNINFFTPNNFGPTVYNIYPLEDWHINLLARWKTGDYDTWSGGGSIPGLKNNVQWRDNWYCDLRISKNFKIAGINVEFFVDIDNVFDIKRLSKYYGFVDSNDRNAYLKSLHLSANTEGAEKFGYTNIPGEDQPGDYRNNGVEYVPIVATKNRNYITNPNSNDLYYDASTGEYLRYINDTWVNEDRSRVNNILDNKAYIDMPNLKHFAFLSPRNVFWGMKLSFEL